MSTISVVVSDRSVLGNEPAGDRTTPPQATDASRIEMRLLRDTRRVLEYLSRTDIYQQLCIQRGYSRDDGDKTLIGTYSFPSMDVL